MHLTLVLSATRTPSLDGAQARLESGPCLARLLSRADRMPDTPQDYAGSLCALFDPALANDPPVAALAASALGLDASTGYWLRADPVHLQPARDDLLLTPVTDLAPEASDGLVATLNGHLCDDGLALSAPAPHSWFIRLPAAPRLHTTPLPAVHGAPMGLHMPEGEDARGWISRLTELQMLLHEHPCNLQRERIGKAPVNAIWLWGGGVLPSLRQSDFDLICCDDALARGLALAAHASSRALPGGFSDLPRGDRVLACLDVADDLSSLESTWFAPMLAALNSGDLQLLEIRISGPPTRIWRTRPRHRWRFWRRPQSGENA